MTEIRIDFEGKDPLVFPAGTDEETIQRVSRNYAKGMVGVDPAPSAVAPEPRDLRARMGTKMTQDPNHMVDLGRSVFQGATLGAGDELIAGAHSLAGGNYDENLQRLRGESAAFEQRSPGAAMASKVMGAAATINPLVAGMKAAPTLVGRAMQGAGLGAGLGAVEGFAGGAGGFENRAADAAKHGSIGAVLGGVLQPVGEAVGPVMEGVKALGRGVRNLTLPPPAMDRARGVMERTLERDQLTPADLQSRLAADRSADVIDVAGENTKRLARTVASQPGEAANMQRSFLDQRRAGHSVDVNDGVLRAFNPEDYTRKLATTRAKLERDAEAAYGEAYRLTPFVRTKEIDDILETPAAQASMRRVLARVQPGQTLQDSALDPQSGLYQLQTLRKIKSDLYAAGKGENALTGGNTEESGYLKNLSNQLNDELKNASTPFKKAAEEYADTAQIIEATKLGREEFAKMTPTAIKDWVKTATRAEREAFMTGVYGHLEQSTLGGMDTNNVARTILHTSRISDRIRAALTPSEWVSLKRQLAHVDEQFQTTQLVGARSGSQTQLRGADEAALDTNAATETAGALGRMATGQTGFLREAGRAGAGIMDRLATRGKGIDEDSAALLARYLFQRQTSPEFAQMQNSLFGAVSPSSVRQPVMPRRLVSPLGILSTRP